MGANQWAPMIDELYQGSHHSVHVQCYLEDITSAEWKKTKQLVPSKENLDFIKVHEKIPKATAFLEELKEPCSPELCLSFGLSTDGYC